MKIDKMTREDFIKMVRESLLMTIDATNEVMGEMVACYLFLQKKGLAAEAENDEEINKEVDGILKEATMAVSKQLEELEKEEAENASL